jgi:tRNA splicing ligase
MINYLFDRFADVNGNIVGIDLWNALQDHIKAGHLVTNYGTGDREGLVLVTYSKTYQYDNNKQDWEPLVKHCRGIIFDTTDNYKIVALPFSKFFNYGEGDIHYPEKGARITNVFTKLDGCCHADTLLTTEDGQTTIKKIVDGKYLGKVLSYNHDTQTKEYKSVLAHSVKENNNDWYELLTSSGETIKLTGDHKVWVDNIGAYRKVTDIKEGDIVLLDKLD